MTTTQMAYDGQQAYRAALQECERWTLQMSFQLMTHNSLDVSTRQLTETNIKTHEVDNCDVSLVFVSFNTIVEKCELIK